MNVVTSVENKKQLDTNAISEVKDFMRVLVKFETFKKKHPKLFTEIMDFQATYNMSLKKADAVTREREVSCGPFQLISYQSRFDGAGINAEVGKDKFEAIGGVIQVVSKIEADDVRKAVNRGHLDVKVAARHETKSPKFKTHPTFYVP